MVKARRQYENDYPSVTEIIGQLRSFALEHWFKITPYDEILVQSKRGKEIGTQMHQCIQDFIEKNNVSIETEYPDEITNALKSFQLFRKENPQFKLKRSEIQLTSETIGVNGTLDCLAEVNDELWIVDWKSQNIKSSDKPKVYSEYRTQISAYVNIYNEVKLANVKKAVIIVLAKDKVSYVIEEIGEDIIFEEFNNVFLPLLKVWGYRNVKKTQMQNM